MSVDHDDRKPGLIGQIAGRVPRSLLRFLVTGSLTVLLDAVVYAALLWLTLPVTAAKGLSLIAATIFAYFANKLWAFSDGAERRGRFIPFLILYISAILLNVAVNAAGLAILDGQSYKYALSWLMATASSSTWNYLGMRYFVFPARAS